MENETVAPVEVADRILAMYPGMFEILITGEFLEVKGTPIILNDMHKQIMWHYIPIACKESARKEDYIFNTGKYIYKF